MHIVQLAIGYACLAFSFIGLLETLLGLYKESSYTFLKVLVYSLSFGLGMALILN